jgi:hypothetical protein
MVMGRCRRRFYEMTAQFVRLDALAKSQLAFAALASLAAGERDAIEVPPRLLRRWVRPTVARRRALVPIGVVKGKGVLDSRL